MTGMKRLIILTDSDSNFLISMADLKNFTSMDVSKISDYFLAKGYGVEVYKFSDLDLNDNYCGVYILYQTAEAPGLFYKHYIEDLVYFLEKQGAFVMPNHELLKAHHNKIFMEMLRSEFTDESLKTIKSRCYGSWVDAISYDAHFPVVIKQSSSAGSAGVYLARNKKEYNAKVRKAGHILVASGLIDAYADFFKNASEENNQIFLAIQAQIYSIRYNADKQSARSSEFH